MNVDLAEEIMADILMYPERLDMGTFYNAPSRGIPVSDVRQWCGTTACIAGYAALAVLPENAVVAGDGFYWESGQERPAIVRGQAPKRVSTLAREALGLTGQQAYVLFYQTSTLNAVPMLKFLIGSPDATAEEMMDFLGLSEVIREGVRAEFCLDGCCNHEDCMLREYAESL